jgi:hypothetical protein
MIKLIKENFGFKELIFLILSALLMCFVVSDLGAWDMLGHLLASEHLRKDIFPHFLGWNFSQLAGYPQGYLYPSLFHWVVALLGNWVGVEASFKCVMVGSTLFLLWAMIRLADEYGETQEEQNSIFALLALFYFFPKGPIGGDYYSTFVIGLVNQAWGMPFYFLFLVYLSRSFRKNASLVPAGLMFGLCILSHAFVTLACAFTFLGFYLAYFKTAFRKSLFISLIGLGVGACWWVPYLSVRTLGAGIGIPYVLFFLPNDLNWILYAALVLFIFAAVLGVFFRLSRKEIKAFSGKLALIYGFGAISIVGGGLDYLNRSGILPIYQKVPIHFYRLHCFSMILMFITLGFWFSNRFARYCLYGAVLLVLAFDFSLMSARRNIHYNIGFNFEKSRRILVHQGRQSLLNELTPHQLADAVNLSGYPTINGLFVESSNTSSFYQSLLYELFDSPFTWGVHTAPTDPDRASEHLKALGIDTILSREPLPHYIQSELSSLESVENLEIEAVIGKAVATEPVFAYHFDNTLFTSVQNASSVESKNWKRNVIQWWNDDDILRTTLLENPSSLSMCPGSTQVTGRLDGTKIDLNIDTKEDCWALIRVSYFPRWHFISEKGQTLEMVRASPHFMAVKGHGKISGRFELSILDHIAEIISIATLVFFFGLWFTKRKRQ